MVVVIALGGCKPYEQLPKPEFGLQEPALDNPTQPQYLAGWTMLDQGKPLSEIPVLDANVKSIAASRPMITAVSPDQADTLRLSIRYIEFQKVLNFRDLGGIRTQDGKQIKWGKIYRSGKLHKLRPEEFESLKDMDIATVIDLRTDGEVEEDPDRIPPNEGIQWVHVPISGVTDEDLHKTKKDIKKQTPEVFDGEGKMQTVMTRFVEQGTPDFARIFDLLLERGENGVVYHCTAGKDRTGLLTALILAALGVDDETIRQDYLLSNYYRYDRIERNARLGAHILGIDGAASRAVMDVRLSYLQASFDAIIAEYGSIESYLKDGLGLDDQKRARLRELYLY